MKVAKGYGYLGAVEPDSLFRKSSFVPQILKQLSSSIGDKDILFFFTKYNP